MERGSTKTEFLTRGVALKINLSCTIGEERAGTESGEEEGGGVEIFRRGSSWVEEATIEFFLPSKVSPLGRKGGGSIGEGILMRRGSIGGCPCRDDGGALVCE